jgi:RNA polymerase sigma factor (sigma-70 family)
MNQATSEEWASYLNEEWMSYLYDEANDVERVRLSEHLQDCVSCQARVAGWRTTQKNLDDSWLRPRFTARKAPPLFGPPLLTRAASGEVCLFAPAPDRLVAEQERAKPLEQALDELPEIYRTVLELRHYRNLKFREIAEVLGVPEGTVKSRMAEALTQFGRLLGPKMGAKRKVDSAGENHLKESLML